MTRYSVQTVKEGSEKFFYILDMETMEMELLPSKYLMHKIRSSRSPNTVKRAAMSLCCYLEYLSEKQMGLTEVYGMNYEEQNQHFVKFLYWLKAGNHRKENRKGQKPPHNGTCNAYLKDVFRFYLFMEENDRSLGSLRVLSYSQITVANTVGGETYPACKIISRIFKGRRTECEGGRTERDSYNPTSLH